MWKRSFRSLDPTRIDKTARLKKSGSVRGDQQKLSSKLQRSFTEAATITTLGNSPSSKSLGPSPIVTLTVGPDGRLFAAHEDVLCQAPFFEVACRGSAFPKSPGLSKPQSKRISLPDEEPEVFSAVLEYLYKGDYYPRLLQDRHRDTWELEDVTTATNAAQSPYLVAASPRTDPSASPFSNTPGGGRAPGPEPTVYLPSVGHHILRDTAVYCAAERYGLDELKRLSLRKQGLWSGIDVATILRSAQYAYAHTPDSDSRLRAHYLALIIRCRKTFKRSGTLQAEMERGGSKLYFDLFVAMCNHLDDVIEATNVRSPKAF